MAPMPNVNVDDSLPEEGCIVSRSRFCRVAYDVKRTAELAPCFMIYNMSELQTF